MPTKTCSHLLTESLLGLHERRRVRLEAFVGRLVRRVAHISAMLSDTGMISYGVMNGAPHLIQVKVEAWEINHFKLRPVRSHNRVLDCSCGLCTLDLDANG